MPDTRDTEGDARGDAAAGTLVSGTLSERRWSFVAGACLVAAVALLAFVGVDAAFVAATLGVVAWFWDQRRRISASVARDNPGSKRDEAEEFEEEGFDDADESEGR